MTDETKRIFDAPFAVMGDSTDYTKFNVMNCTMRLNRLQTSSAKDA